MTMTMMMLRVMETNTNACDVSGSHSGIVQDPSHLGCYNVLTCQQQPTFRPSILILSSGSNSPGLYICTYISVYLVTLRMVKKEPKPVGDSIGQNNINSRICDIKEVQLVGCQQVALDVLSGSIESLRRHLYIQHSPCCHSGFDLPHIRLQAHRNKILQFKFSLTTMCNTFLCSQDSVLGTDKQTTHYVAGLHGGAVV